MNTSVYVKGERGRVVRNAIQVVSDFGWLTSNEYLVDPASCHMLVSKIKPCMSKHKPNMVKPRMAHYNSLSLLDLRVLHG